MEKTENINNNNNQDSFERDRNEVFLELVRNRLQLNRGNFINVLKVSQIDAYTLDFELNQILFHQLENIFRFTNIASDHKPELRFLFDTFMFYLSIWSSGTVRTFGQRIQNIHMIDEKTGNNLIGMDRLKYGLLTVVMPYVWSKLSTWAHTSEEENEETELLIREGNELNLRREGETNLISQYENEVPFSFIFNDSMRDNNLNPNPNSETTNSNQPNDSRRNRNTNNSFLIELLGGRERVSRMKGQIAKVMSVLEYSWKVLSLCNFLLFLNRAKYVSIVHRLLGLIHEYTNPHLERQISFQFMNRELIWNGFSEFLVFILPLINLKRIKRNLIRTLQLFSPITWLTLSEPNRHHKGLLDSRESLGERMKRGCGICLSPRLYVVHEAIPCGHLYCYYCIQKEVMSHEEDGERFLCVVCNREVTGLKRPEVFLHQTHEYNNKKIET